MAEHHKQLHVAMFPWLAFGHIIPFFEVAKLIAQKGHRISFISTPRNIQRLPYVPPDLSKLINLVSVPLPHEDNLPPDAEATMDIPHHTVPYLKKAFDGLHQGLANFLQDSTPDWIIYDFAPHWLGPIAESLGISRAFFNIFNAATFGFFAPSTSSMINGDDSRKEPKHFTVPPPWVPFPSNVAFRLHEAKRILDHLDENPSGATDGFRAGSVIAGCEVLVIRSCMELEPQWLRLCSHLHGKPIVPIGLLPPSLPVDKDTVDETWQTMSQWLDKQKKGSVVYIAMGSELSLSQDNITELALGLELSGLPFFWVLRKQNASADSDSVELPDGFTERIKDRGIVWTSWAPQLRTLAHESIGGFLTHCGWSSIIEGLSFGRALIMLPFAIDQGLNARIFEEKKTGIEVPRNEQDGSFTRTSLAESLRLVLVEDEGKIYRENAVEMSKMFGNNNLHDRYMKDFIRYLEKHKTGTQEEMEEMT